MNKPIVHVVAALIFDDHNRLIITRRPEGKHLAGMWEFPGGRIEPDETPQQALVREIREELNLEIEVGALYYQDLFEYDVKSVDISFFHCRQKNTADEPQAVEVAEWKRVRLSQLEQYEFPPADTALIRQLLEFDFMFCRI
jgi:mutator protein MutT